MKDTSQVTSWNQFMHRGYFKILMCLNFKIYVKLLNLRIIVHKLKIKSTSMKQQPKTATAKYNLQQRCIYVIWQTCYIIQNNQFIIKCERKKNNQKKNKPAA